MSVEPEKPIEAGGPLADLAQLVLGPAPVTTRCAHCPETFAGTIEDGHAWFAAHRAEAHPELPPPRERPKRRGF